MTLIIIFAIPCVCCAAFIFAGTAIGAYQARKQREAFRVNNR